MKEFSDPNKHNLDWKGILKEIGTDIYKEGTYKNPKTDARLTHDPLPDARL